MLSRDNSIRVLLFALGVLGALFAPFWVPLMCMLLLSMRFRAWEVLFLGLLIDFLWLPSVGYLHPVPLFTVGSILLVWALEPLRREFLV